MNNKIEAIVFWPCILLLALSCVFSGLGTFATSVSCKGLRAEVEQMKTEVQVLKAQITYLEAMRK